MKRTANLLTDVDIGRANELFDFIRQIPRHFFGRNVGKRAQGEADDVHVGVVHVVLERVGDHGEELLVLVEQEHNAEVAELLVGKARGRDQLEALDLAKVGGVAEHVDVEQLFNVGVPGISVFVLERGAYGCGFLVDDDALVCESLA